MKKPQTMFTCSNCDAQFTKWTGRCLECGKWGTVNEVESHKVHKVESSNSQYEPIITTRLSEIDGKNIERMKTGVEELDRVLGGGIVPGSLILLGGEPGVGKSTLALQIASLIPNTFYCSGEESVGQIKLRADRMKIKSESLCLANETDVDRIIATINGQSSKKNNETIEQWNNVFVVVDSIQTISSSEVAGEAGNINQIKACTVKLMEVAKKTGVPIIIVGQVTKDGNVAGPKTLEHLVDTVLYLEGDRYHLFRILRAEKNRFGSTDEIGIFEMNENGLEEVNNPSQSFLQNKPQDVPGSTVTCLMEGSRPMLIEIQALVTKTNFGYPQRKASGFDLNRLQVLIAVLTKRTGLPLDNYDVFLNVAGGMRANEPAADLAVVLAIASAIKNKILPQNLVSFGEVGLGGEVRPVNQVKKRLEEIKKLGFEFAVVPYSTKTEKNTGLKIAPVKNVSELVEKIIK
jgi:DNA repair protein RadA/Sms